MKHWISILTLLLPLQALAADWQENPQITALFKAAEVNGCFVVCAAGASHCSGHNRARAQQRFIPASTFKIANSLIGLATDAVASVDEVLPYGGQPQPFKAWERNMGLREAISVSNVPVYQALARRIGLQRMQAGVAWLDYGNREIGTVVDVFWLRGPLRISALEQAQFLNRLAQNTLPLPDRVQADVREILLLEQGDGWALYGKTGWHRTTGAGTGWWVGWVQRQGQVHGFALNMDMRDKGDAGKRVELGKASLAALGLL